MVYKRFKSVRQKQRVMINIQLMLINKMTKLATLTGKPYCLPDLSHVYRPEVLHTDPLNYSQLYAARDNRKMQYSTNQYWYDDKNPRFFS